MTDHVNSPQHYQFRTFEAKDVIEEVIATYHDPVIASYVRGALEYLFRAPRKGGIEDVRKAGKLLAFAEAYWSRRALGELAKESQRLGLRGVSASRPGCDVPHPLDACSLAQRDGAGEYGNPVTPWRLP